MQKYNSVLKQRNELLKQIRATFANVTQLDAWDKLLLLHGTAVIIKRLEIFHLLKVYAVENHQKLTGGLENLALTYRSASMANDTSIDTLGYGTSEMTAPNSLAEFSGVPHKAEDKITTHFGMSLDAARETDLQRGTTSVGPHRDDFLIELEDGPEGHPTYCHQESDSEAPNLEIGTFREVARAYGSQGQQRTIALALKLAELELIRHLTGRDPIVLLDDVTSELDYKRIGYLLDVLQNLSAQIFITATHAEPLVHHLDRPNVLTVENAQVNCTSETNGF